MERSLRKVGLITVIGGSATLILLLVIGVSVDGEYFQGLGKEYGTQNPVWTMNHFPENLRLPNGQRAYETWTGGWLGVAGKQIEDFTDMHDKWYMKEALRDFR